MKYIITSVKDELRGFTTFELNDNVEIAKRNFKQLVQNNELIKDNANDFSLWTLGEYDKETGVITSNETTKISSALDFILEVKA